MYNCVLLAMQHCLSESAAAPVSSQVAAMLAAVAAKFCCVCCRCCTTVTSGRTAANGGGHCSCCEWGRPLQEQRCWGTLKRAAASTAAGTGAASGKH
jgi:hypothetical protein